MPGRVVSWQKACSLIPIHYPGTNNISGSRNCRNYEILKNDVNGLQILYGLRQKTHLRYIFLSMKTTHTTHNLTTNKPVCVCFL